MMIRRFYKTCGIYRDHFSASCVLGGHQLIGHACSLCSRYFIWWYFVLRSADMRLRDYPALKPTNT